jgi:hypothetical protein
MREAIERICHPFDLFISLSKGCIRPYARFDQGDFSERLGFRTVHGISAIRCAVPIRSCVHTKRSPHLPDDDGWRRALIDGVLGSSRLIDRIVAAFRGDPDLGMVVAEGNIFSGQEY